MEWSLAERSCAFVFFAENSIEGWTAEISIGVNFILSCEFETCRGTANRWRESEAGGFGLVRYSRPKQVAVIPFKYPRGGYYGLANGPKQRPFHV